MNEIEEKMADILDSIPVEYEDQYEVGKRRFRAKCRSKYPCSSKDAIDDYDYNDDDEDDTPDWRNQFCRASDGCCEWQIKSQIRPIFVLDFAIFIANTTNKLDIEVDGFWFHKADEVQIANDLQRDRRLNNLGWTVLRFRADEVHNKPGHVAKRVKEVIADLQPKTEAMF